MRLRALLSPRDTATVTMIGIVCGDGGGEPVPRGIITPRATGRAADGGCGQRDYSWPRRAGCRCRWRSWGLPPVLAPSPLRNQEPLPEPRWKLLLVLETVAEPSPACVGASRSGLRRIGTGFGSTGSGPIDRFFSNPSMAYHAVRSC